MIGHLFWRRHPDLNWGVADLQSAALPLGYGAICDLRAMVDARKSFLERLTRLELATSTLARWLSTGGAKAAELIA